MAPVQHNPSTSSTSDTSTTPSFTTYHGSPTGKVTASTHKPIPLQPTDVAIRITHSGVCGTDLHYTHSSQVLGHEGVGIVTHVGSSVKSFRIGDRVGYGYVKSGCGHCEQCLEGHHFHCTNGGARAYSSTDLDQGSFAEMSVWPETLVHKVPEGLSSKDAAPLFCAGQTVFVPLLRHGVKSTDRVGVVGVGGLGHLAVQFASKMGCEVVVFSGSESKKEEAMRLGAKEFVATRGVKKLSLQGGRGIDHLLVTTAALPDWDLYMDVMNPFGKIYPLTVTTEPMHISFLPFLIKELQFIGNCTSTPMEVERMLQFAAFHGVKPVLERFPMSEEGIKDALTRLEKGDIRYRGVLEAQA